MLLGICFDCRPSDAVNAELNIPYVVQFGFGSYDIGGLSATTFRIPLAHNFKLDPEDDGLRIKFTGYLGFSHLTFDTRLANDEFKASQEFLFALPQAELIVPLAKGWTLKPYLAAGAGWAFNGSKQLNGTPEESITDSYIFLYTAGAGTLYEIPVEKFRVSLGSKIGWAEAREIGGSGKQGYATLQAGTEIRHPLGVHLSGHELSLAGSFIYYFFFPPAQFSMPEGKPLKVTHQFEFGTTFGFVEPAKIWFIENPQIGMSYRFGDGMTGFRVNLGFPF